MHRQDNETPALNALKALRGAPISMGRGEIPVELRPAAVLNEKTTYRFGNRSFVVESVFKEESPDTLGSVLLRLMKAENEKM